MAAPLLLQRDRLPSWPLLASLGVHAALVFLTFVKKPEPAAWELSPLRYSGQTFDVEAIGEGEDNSTAAASDPSSAPKPPAPQEENTSPETPLAERETEESEARLAPAQEPFPREETGGEKQPSSEAPKDSEEVQAELEEQVPAEPSSEPVGAARETEKEETSADAQTPSQVDPFDLATPGEKGSDTASASAAAQQAGAYGQQDDGPAVVDLFKAFLKTLPLAAKADPSWTSLPLGTAGSLEFSVSVSESLALGPIEIHTSHSPAPHLEKMVKKNRRFLLHGRFALSPQENSGHQKLRLSAVISEKAPDPEKPEAPGVAAFGLRGEGKPTGAYFTYFSGRHVELRLQRLPN